MRRLLAKVGHTNHSSGYCDDEDECNCSEEPLALTDRVRKLLGDMNVFDYIKLRIDEFSEQVQSWKIPEEVRELALSRCKVDSDGR